MAANVSARSGALGREPPGMHARQRARVPAGQPPIHSPAQQRASPPTPTSPVISTNSCLALTTTQTGTLASRALISSGLNPRSNSGCAARAEAARAPAGAPPRRALTDCRQERRQAAA